MGKILFSIGRAAYKNKYTRVPYRAGATLIRKAKEYLLPSPPISPAYALAGNCSINIKVIETRPDPPICASVRNNGGISKRGSPGLSDFDDDGLKLFENHKRKNLNKYNRQVRIYRFLSISTAALSIAAVGIQYALYSSLFANPVLAFCAVLTIGACFYSIKKYSMAKSNIKTWQNIYYHTQQSNSNNISAKGPKGMPQSELFAGEVANPLESVSEDISECFYRLAQIIRLQVLLKEMYGICEKHGDIQIYNRNIAQIRELDPKLSEKLANLFEIFFLINETDEFDLSNNAKLNLLVDQLRESNPEIAESLMKIIEEYRKMIK